MMLRIFMPVAVVYMIAETVKTVVTLTKQYKEYKAKEEEIAK